MNGDPVGRGLIDTNIVIQLPRLDVAVLPREMVISAITLAELSAGPHHAKGDLERARRVAVVQHVESAFDALPFDAEAARVFGLVSAAVLAVGRTTRGRTADLMIASVAIANGLPLYTTNPADFAGLDQLLDVAAVPVPGTV